MANSRLKRKPVAGKVGFKAAEGQEEQGKAEVPSPAGPQDEAKSSGQGEVAGAESAAAGSAARDQEEAAERERLAAEHRDRERTEAEERERQASEEAARRAAEEAAEAKRQEAEAREREAQERAEREAAAEAERVRAEEEVRARQEAQRAAADEQADQAAAGDAGGGLTAEEREARLRASIERAVGDVLQLDLGQGDTLSIDLRKARAIQGSDNRQRNTQVPPQVAKKVRNEAKKNPDDSHALVLFRALSKVMRYPEEFGELLRTYRNGNAVSDPLLGITIASGKRTRRNPVKLQYNPTLEFDELLIDLADQVRVSKAVWVSLMLVFYWDLDVALI
jgi:hypothetical protein